MRITNETRAEFIGQVIDIFEDFLEEKGITIDNPEKTEDPNEDPDCIANIYGTDYGMLQDQLEELLQNWGIVEE